MEVIEQVIVKSIYKTRRKGFVFITDLTRDHDLSTEMQSRTLITGRDTKIRDQFGKRIGLWNLREGMVINVFTDTSTRSNRLQSKAHQITIVREKASSLMEEGRILETEWFSDDYRYLLTGDANNINNQIRYLITKTTLLRDEEGNPIPYRVLRPGQLITIERSPGQTMSIPPQANALTIQILSNFF